jgi:hypothetical protein
VIQSNPKLRKLYFGNSGIHKHDILRLLGENCKDLEYVSILGRFDTCYLRDLANGCPNLKVSGKRETEKGRDGDEDGEREREKRRERERNRSSSSTFHYFFASLFSILFSFHMK